jgi:O-antigen/teichoic acid export membrane protein
MGISLRDEAARSIGHTALMIPFRAYGMCVQFFLSFFLARVLSAEGFGRWGLMLAISQWGYTFFFCWHTTGISRYGREEFLASRTMRTTFGSRLALYIPSFLLLLIVAACGAAYFGRLLAFPASITVLLLTYTLAFSLSETVQYTLPAIGRSDLTSAVLAVERTLVLALVTAFYVGGKLNPVTTLASVTIPALLINGAMMLRIRRDCFPAIFDRAHIRRYLRFCLPVLIIAPAGGIIGWVDLFVIHHFMELGDVGRYFLAFQFYNAVAQMSFLITVVAGPFTVAMVMKDKSEHADLFLNRLQWISYAGAAALALAATPIAWLVFHFTAGPRADDVERLWLALMPGSIASFLTATAAALYMAKEDTRTPGWIGGLVMLTKVALSITLVPIYGAIGAAWATSAAMLISHFLLFRCLCRFGLQPRGVLIRTLACLLPAVVPWLARPLLHVAASAITLAVAGATAVWAVKEIRDLMRRR